VIELHISEAAALSVVEQADYYQQVADLALAQRWESAVDQAAHSLLTEPERGSICRFHSSALAGLRWIFVPGFPKHMVFYRFQPRKHVILIVQVLHGARNLQTLVDDDQ
jgi:plasmid stabilization system protein ParE